MVFFLLAANSVCTFLLGGGGRASGDIVLRRAGRGDKETEIAQAIPRGKRYQITRENAQSVIETLSRAENITFLKNHIFYENEAQSLFSESWVREICAHCAL